MFIISLLCFVFLLCKNHEEKGKVNVMSLFKGPMNHHIPGHKDLTDHKDVLELKPQSQVYIPLFANHSTAFELLVAEGDYVYVGTKVAVCNDRMTVPIYSSVSGTVGKVQKMMHSTLKPQDHLCIESDGKYEKKQAFKPLDYQKSGNEELVEFMMNAGIIGCGGAGFPTYIKYKSAKDIKNVIINGVECEPYITADHKMIQANLDLMVTGILAMKKMAQAQEVVIAIKKTHSNLIKQVHEAVANIGGVRVVAVPDVYPMGWERTLVRHIMKKDYDKLPSEVGAIVNNVSTAIAFGEALIHGMPIVEKIVTISGDGVKSPTNVKVPVGMQVKEIMEACGGYTADDVKLIAGGPMMGKTIVNDQFVVDRPSNAITVLKTVPFTSVACLRCGQCSDHCPAGLQPVRIAQALNANDKAMMDRLSALDCIECGLCTYVCPSRLDVTENARKAKRQILLAKK